MKIYGAGMAGLLAGQMLRRFNPTICEQKESLPHNHEALLRFRSDDVSIATGIPFKKVHVHKAIKYGNEIETIPNLFYSNLYSGKVIGAYLDRSINNLDSVDRFISPFNFIELMAQNLNIEYNTPLDHSKCVDARYGMKNDGDSFPLITTIPIPMMMDIVEWEKKPIFNYKTIWSQKTIIEDPEVCVNQTIYYPDPKTNFYRISITDNVVIAEYIIEPKNTGPDIMGALRDDFGIDACKLAPIAQTEMKYGKLLPIDENIRKEFILYLTQEYNIFSVGRFATWRQLLLDDVVKDIKIVEGLIGDAYKTKLQSEKGKKDV
tara:strand:+ start:10557 stop:11513 length:957 start_codon:yes stop_codon:yes gene_type:complete